jgi:hypothetical protein
MFADGIDDLRRLLAGATAEQPSHPLLEHSSCLQRLSSKRNENIRSRTPVLLCLAPSVHKAHNNVSHIGGDTVTETVSVRWM